MEPVTLDESLHWVRQTEPFWSWAVVLVIVRWFVTRIDTLITELKKAVTAFEDFEKGEVRTHDALRAQGQSIRETQVEILTEIRKCLEVGK